MLVALGRPAARLPARTDRVARWEHHTLSVFGIGADIEDAQWRNIFRQLVALGHVAVDHAAYGALRLTESARPILRGERTVEMRHAPERGAKKPRPRIRPNVTLGADADLLARLKAWRVEEAKRQGVPAYDILHDATLVAIAQVAPAELDGLAGISGIGQKRLERYGEAVLAIVRTAGKAQGGE